MPILLLDVALGAVLLAMIALAATRSPVGPSSQGRRAAGWILVAVPLPLAVGIQIFAPMPLPLGEIAFIAGLTAFAAGALLILSGDDEDDLRGSTEPEDPPWWPEFEREFRAHVRGSQRLRVLR